MSALSDFTDTIKSWVDDLNPTNALVESWVRIGEERMNNELRVDEMIVRTYATFEDNCIELPPDWLKTLYVRVKGGVTYNFVSNKEYFDGLPLGITPGRYTNVGRTLFVWPPVDPETVFQMEVGYYAKLPPLGEIETPVKQRFPGLYLNCALAAGAPFLIEDERLNTFAMLATAGIKQANDQAIAARFSGSPIRTMMRSFG